MKMLVESTVAENTEYFDGKKKAKKKKAICLRRKINEEHIELHYKAMPADQPFPSKRHCLFVNEEKKQTTTKQTTTRTETRYSNRSQGTTTLLLSALSDEWQHQAFFQTPLILSSASGYHRIFCDFPTKQEKAHTLESQPSPIKCPKAPLRRWKET